MPGCLHFSGSGISGGLLEYIPAYLARTKVRTGGMIIYAAVVFIFMI